MWGRVNNNRILPSGVTGFSAVCSSSFLMFVYREHFWVRVASWLAKGGAVVWGADSAAPSSSAASCFISASLLPSPPRLPPCPASPVRPAYLYLELLHSAWLPFPSPCPPPPAKPFCMPLVLDCRARMFRSPFAGAYALSSICAACPQGRYSAAASASCTACPAGSGSDNTGSTSVNSCTTCAAGKYANGTGCFPCPLGQVCVWVRGVRVRALVWEHAGECRSNSACTVVC